MYAGLRRLQYHYIFYIFFCNTYVLSNLIESIKEQAKTGNLHGERKREKTTQMDPKAN